MEMFVFILFQLLMEVQPYKPPDVLVSPNVISEFSSVKISCEMPVDVKLNKCYFYINRKVENTKVSQSCELKFTGAEVLRWADEKSPASVDIHCFYIINEENIDKPSSHSPVATLMVLGLLQARLSASASDLQQSDTVELSCNNTEDLKMEMCFFSINGRERNSKVSSSCQLSLTGAQISVWSEDQSLSVKLTCFYTVKMGQVPKQSPHSNPVIVTVHTKSSDETLTTALKTTVPHVIHSEGSWFLVVLVFTGIGLFLSALIGLICLCHMTRSDDVLTEVTYTE